VDRFTDKETGLMLGIIKKRKPSLVDGFNKSGFVQKHKEELIQMLLDEFCEKGLENDDEPNDYGKSIDDLIGRIVLLGLDPSGD
jgi:hypothetical protein